MGANVLCLNPASARRYVRGASSEGPKYVPPSALGDQVRALVRAWRVCRSCGVRLRRATASRSAKRCCRCCFLCCCCAAASAMAWLLAACCSLLLVLPPLLLLLHSCDISTGRRLRCAPCVRHCPSTGQLPARSLAQPQKSRTSPTPHQAPAPTLSPARWQGAFSPLKLSAAVLCAVTLPLPAHACLCLLLSAPACPCCPC